MAKIDNDYTITFKDLQDYVYDWFYDKRYRDMTRAYHDALDAMVTNQLKRFDFFEKELHKDKELIQSIRRIINEQLVNEYYTRQYVNKYANKDSARKVYDMMDKQVGYREIFLNIPEKSTKQQIKSIKQKALEIKTEIENGKDFGKLAKLYSQDTTSFSGYTRHIGWEQAISNPIHRVIFKLDAGDVRVLIANDGFHIVKVTNIGKIKVKPFNDIKNEIINKLKNAYYNKTLEEYEHDKNKLIDENRLTWNEKALQQIVKWSKNPQFYEKMYKDTLPNAIAHNNFTILTYSEGNIDLKEYFRLLNNVLIPKSADNTTDEDIKRFILEAIRTDKIVKKAKTLGLENNIFHARTANPVLQNKIAYLYNVAVIDSQIPGPTDEMLHTFYKQQKDSLYYQLKKVNIYAMIFSEEQKAKDVMQRIKNGTPFEEITGRYLVKTFIRDRDGNIKTFKSAENALFRQSCI
ncbi:MAG: peptidylprolyl isomerase [candidate division KSB1 bacterium]|nr:peptidylprolyl isomerase [candidate division KSB1 bacterium]